MFDYIIVGAGLSGAVMAERIASQMNRKVLIIEKRPHIAGNIYDRHNEHGIFIHQYGPHIFHTKLKNVWEYLSRFTDWHLYHHHVLGSIDGKKVPIPFNINSLYELFPDSVAKPLEEKLISHFGFNVKVPILKLREADDEELKWLADFIYEKIFLHYTTKQWGLKPEEIDPYVTGRVPVYISRDNRYFQDAYQGVPKVGYTAMVDKMLDHPNIKIMLNADYKEIVSINPEGQLITAFGQPFNGKLVFTGKIDELFDYKHGELPYRSLNFDFETLDQPSYQPVGTVNYPNEYDFTRITEFKHLTGQKHEYTSIVKEYPQPYDKNRKGQDIPYYPVPRQENQDLYERYRDEAKSLKQIVLLGRLADYKYYDMDACVAKALKVFEQQIAAQ